MNVNEYAVESFSLGDKISADKIVFKSLEDLNEALKDIDNGNDIYLVKEGEITILPHRMISAKIYEGSITLCARRNKKKEA